MVTDADTTGRVPVPRSEQGSFPYALRAAIAASGLPLDRIQQRLYDRGTPVSVATLSYWQSGRTQPERAGSLRALHHLEEVLEVPVGALSRLLSRPRPRGRGRRESRMLPMGALWGQQEEVARLLSGVDTRWDEHLVRLNQHDRVRVGARHAQSSLRVRQVLRADQDGPDRWVVVFYTDKIGQPLPKLYGLRNCRTGRVLTDAGAGILVAELLFDQPLRQGDTLITEHEFVYHTPSLPRMSDWCGRTLRMQSREYLLEVVFHPDALPAGCEEFSEPAGGPCRTRRLTLDSSRSAHALAVDFGPGAFGIRWWWDDS